MSPAGLSWPEIPEGPEWVGGSGKCSCGLHPSALVHWPGSSFGQRMEWRSGGELPHFGLMAFLISSVPICPSIRSSIHPSSIQLAAHLFVYSFTQQSICLSSHHQAFIHLSFHLSFYLLPIHLYIRLHVHLSVYIYASIFLSICPVIYKSSHLSICPIICPFIHLFTWCVFSEHLPNARPRAPMDACPQAYSLAPTARMCPQTPSLQQEEPIGQV